MFIRQSGKTRIVGTDSLLWMDTQIILTAAKSPAKLTVVKVKPWTSVIMESNCYGLNDNSLGSDSQFFFNPTANSSNSPIVIVQDSVAIKNAPYSLLLSYIICFLVGYTHFLSRFNWRCKNIPLKQTFSRKIWLSSHTPLLRTVSITLTHGLESVPLIKERCLYTAVRLISVSPHTEFHGQGTCCNVI